MSHIINNIPLGKIFKKIVPGFFLKSFSNTSLQLSIVLLVLLALLTYSCNHNTKADTGVTYTCPMPEDSVFSDKPGKCPKCGMDLVPVNETQPDTAKSEAPLSGYTCPMHPQVHSDKPGVCPICGMDLERVRTDNEPLSLSLEMLLKPANQAVVANVPMVHLAQREEDLELEVFGNVEYNTDYTRVISSRISGRITKMFVKFRYQNIKAGQPVMEIYSQELVAAQNNYLFLKKNDTSNYQLIEAAKQRLLLSGMSERQIAAITRSGKSIYSVTIYSSGSGIVDESGDDGQAPVIGGTSTLPLTLKEGMYVEKGQPLFLLLNPSKARIALQIFPHQQSMLKKGDKVRIQPEANPKADFRATISDIVPYYQPQSNTLIARIPFDNDIRKLPIGSTVKAVIFTGFKNASWLPEEAVTSLGLEKVVFVREQDGFVARKVKTGIISKHLVQILDGLEPNEAVAANAGFLVDSESFIMTKNDKR